MKLADRARVHAALGDEHRLAVVDALSAGDRTPGELASLIGIPTNLLAHHLNVLEEADLVERRVSEGDHRRRYLVLRRDVLVRVAVPALPVPDHVAFVCTHNSARSQYAAAAFRERTGRVAGSAGRTPAARVHPLAVQVASERGIDLRSATPAGYESLPASLQLVISVCDRAAEAESPPTEHHVHWSVPDPVAGGGEDSFRSAFDELDRRLDAWLGHAP